ncbi:MAG: phosphodiesterase [Ruminococcaceae bacterium]|nr:phosphodiesterase [Oscillospiraceae bacterium]
MKIMIASDIHGSAKYAGILTDRFNESGADKLLLLGDILYHGPRNDLPEEYAPKKVIELLNPLKDKILAVRGNCDTEVDQMVLDFPILADYAVITTSERTIYATHGHKYGPDNPPPLCNGDILLGGHTHVTKAQEYDKFIYINPGSVSIPKEGTKRGYIILENGIFRFYDIEGNYLMKY